MRFRHGPHVCQKVDGRSPDLKQDETLNEPMTFLEKKKSRRTLLTQANASRKQRLPSLEDGLTNEASQVTLGKCKVQIAISTPPTCSSASQRNSINMGAQQGPWILMYVDSREVHWRTKALKSAGAQSTTSLTSGSDLEEARLEALKQR